MNLIKKFLNRYIYQDWNIAIADIGSDMTPVNIRWMQHGYRDRWFADPFIVSDTDDTYTVLVEEFIHSDMRGRLARLTISKHDCRLLLNETILDLPTHLSFPNYIDVDGRRYIYPENAGSGSTHYYLYDSKLEYSGVLSDIPFADPVIINVEGMYYLLATEGRDCNGSILHIYRSAEPLSGYVHADEVKFADNIARRAGHAFYNEGRLIIPAQVCNNDYGEGVSLQQITQRDGRLIFTEIKRMMPMDRKYPEGFHTYNVYGDKVVIDGYRYGSKFLHNLYFKIRK